jgi:hypothetical protein
VAASTALVVVTVVVADDAEDERLHESIHSVQIVDGDPRRETRDWTA